MFTRETAAILFSFMKGEKDVKISYWAAHLTTIVSVTLVLILVGVIALITLSSRRESHRLLEQLEVSVILADTVSDNQASALTDQIAGEPYALETGYITKQQAMTAWKRDTGEDLEELFGVNPLSPEIYFKIKADYSGEESLDEIYHNLAALPGVEEVAMPDSELVSAMNRNIGNLAIILGVIAFVMVIISFVLINNTVHLTIYARRFTIHTMQLVGATDAFIKRPFVMNNLLAGLISAMVAAGILALSLAVAPRTGLDDVATYIPWWLFAAVAGGMVISGPLLCGVAASLATSGYLKKDYDELFR